jgi:hypothetical protein
VKNFFISVVILALTISLQAQIVNSYEINVEFFPEDA